MDWDLKMPTWDFAELERGDNCSVDLKLGGFGYIRPFDCWKNSTQPMVATSAMVSSSSSSGSLKRPRPPSNGCHIASCSVDGCLSDLSKSREYHRRHKVCEVHSKTAIVMVGGREQRFCQQCSRFHLLVEFDEVKRSCRKRLDGHNRRRRKPQQDPLISGSFTGNRFTSYHQVFATPTPKSNWPMLIKTEGDFPLYTHRSPRHVINELQHFPVSSSGSYKEVKQFPFLQENIQISISQPLLTATSIAAASNSNNNKMFDSDCALSLLSSSAALISDVSLSQVVHPIGPGQYFPNGFSCHIANDERVGTALVSDGNGADFNSNGLFHVGLEGSSDGNSHTLPFSWQ